MRIEERKQVSGARIDPSGGVRGATSLPDALGHGDRVELSDTDRMLVRLRAEVGPVDRVRAGVVGRLRDQIERGEYRPDYAAVAQSLLRDVMEQVVACAQGTSRNRTPT